jgi:dipeptidyl aminopeptidase/acylaminoacyl peptidase
MAKADGSGIVLDAIEGEIGGMGGPPWTFPYRYLENSPIYFLDRVTTPLTIVAGSLDECCVHGSDLAFVGLQRLNKDVTYLRYEGERHALGRYENLIDYWTRVTEFLDKHLKAHAGPHFVPERN